MLEQYKAYRKKLTRPFYRDFKNKVNSRKETAFHEVLHALPIISFGKSLQEISVKPTSEYSGVTIPGSNLSDKQMQIAAMGSDGLSGNGSDVWKARVLEGKTGLSANNASKIAKNIHSTFGEKIIDIVASYLDHEETASDSRFREYINWAKEDLVLIPIFDAMEREESLAA